MKELSVIISETLVEARKSNGYTQQQVADMIGTGVSYVKDYESGRKGVSIRQFQAIAKKLGAKQISIQLHF
jgi:transcriptional regulator with XRE-family HTH domain